MVHQPYNVGSYNFDEYPYRERSEEREEKKKEPIKIIISSEINGRTIAQVTRKVPPLVENPLSPALTPNSVKRMSKAVTSVADEVKSSSVPETNV